MRRMLTIPLALLPAAACISTEPVDAVDSDGSSSSSSSGNTTAEIADVTTSETLSSGSESSSTGPEPCVDNEDCPDAAAPFCEPVSGECVGCDGTADPDGACAGLDSTNPVCAEGTCVQCTTAASEACMGTTPLCDDATNSCVPCTAHDQCGQAACNLFTGACLPGDAVVHVGGPRPDFPNLAMAVDSFAAGAEGTIVVHQANYDEAITVDGGRVLAFLANDGDTPLWALLGGGSPQLTVGNATVLLDGLRLSSNADDVGLRMNGGQAWVDRSRIVQNSGGGVLASNGAQLTLRNSFVGGGGALDVDAIAVNASTIDMLYTTVGGGAAVGGRTRALFCEGAATADVRNSILVSIDAMSEVECPGATLTTSATEADVGNLDIMWFMGYANGDFHLSASGQDAFDGLAEWRTGDPTTDIDGDARPTENGTPDYAGADLVP